MNVIISLMTLADLEEIKDKLVSEFDDFWTYSIFASELKNENSMYFVAKNNDEMIVGFAGIWKAVDDIHITNIVTKKDKRHLGIASKLLEHLICVSKKDGLPSLTLEVNENNMNAIHLYEKYNFQKIGIRKNYYGQNENAMIMTYYFK